MGTTLFHLVAGRFLHGSHLAFLEKFQKLPKSRDCNWSAQPIFFKHIKQSAGLTTTFNWGQAFPHPHSHNYYRLRYTLLLVLWTTWTFLMTFTSRWSGSLQEVLASIWYPFSTPLRRPTLPLYVACSATSHAVACRNCNDTYHQPIFPAGFTACISFAPGGDTIRRISRPT